MVQISTAGLKRRQQWMNFPLIASPVGQSPMNQIYPSHCLRMNEYTSAQSIP